MVIASLLLGESHVMRELRRLIAMLAPRTIPVMIEGESGVGKELVARALHDASGRSGAFVPFNICAISESMFEASLFGHVRGAFSGAIGDSDGLLTQGHLGTVFLDEISGLLAPMQPKLLRAVELGIYRPIGARHDRRSEFRVVAATNESLSELVALGGFRADLAYRLRGCVVRVPALREHSEDIPLLASHILRQNALKFGDSTLLTNRAQELLRDYSWPGNVRELKSVLACAAMMGSGVIDAEAIHAALSHQRGDGATRPLPRPEIENADERLKLLLALEAAGWDTSQLARERDVSRATIYRHMARLEIVPRGRGALPGQASRPTLTGVSETAWSCSGLPLEVSG